MASVTVLILTFFLIKVCFIVSVELVSTMWNSAETKNQNYLEIISPKLDNSYYGFHYDKKKIKKYIIEDSKIV